MARFEDEREHYEVLLSLPATERDAYLDRDCPSELREGVRELLEQTDTSPFITPNPALLGAEAIGDCTIIEQLGKGPTGVVYLAWDNLEEQKVALKVVDSVVSSQSPTLLLKYDAPFQAALEHPAILRVYRSGEDKQFTYIVSEYVPGLALHDFCKESKLKAKDICALMAPMADALEHAHKNNIVHHNVKPSNILIQHGGAALLSDFGLAEARSLATQSGHLLGTLPYLSPEQIQTKPGQVDHRTDIFSLGVVIYEMVTGSQPFVGQTMKQLRHAITTEFPPSITQFVTSSDKSYFDLQIVIEKAMKKRRRNRYQTAGDLAHDLRQVANGSRALLAEEPRVTWRGRKWISHYPLLSALVMCGIVIAIFAAVIWAQ